MQVEVTVPCAFSVRDDHEFYPIEHLVAKLNPGLHVARVATGVHVHGGSTVFWGIVYDKSESLSQDEIEATLKEAGLDFSQSYSLQSESLQAG